MFLFVISFLFGDMILQCLPRLPSLPVLLGIIICWISVFLKRRVFYLILVTGCAAGFIFAWWYAATTLMWTLPKNAEGRLTIVRGHVASLPVKSDWQTQFIFVLDNSKVKIKLALRDSNIFIAPGDHWQFSVRLKRIHGTQNPGGFDYEAWALQNGIRAAGYIVRDDKNHLIAHHWYVAPVAQVRFYLQQKIQKYLPVSQTSAWLMALMIGERSGIPPEQWQILRATGTNHLMAIAGLHIGMVVGFVYLFVFSLWRRVAWLVLIMPAQQAALIFALLVACLYSVCAGFSVPTQRACIMFGIIALIRMHNLVISAWMIWALALMLVLLLNPLVILSESFWLSFGTIALIIYGMRGRIAPSGWWWKWCRVQWVIGFGLIPFSIYFFHEFSIVSFIANMIAIPWLCFLILPFCLLGLILLIVMPSCTAVLLYWADKSLAGLWSVLTWFAHLQHATWQFTFSHTIVFLLVLLGFILLLAPLGFAGRWFGLLWLLPLVLHPSSPNILGDVSLTVLDVGQGLSCIVRTKRHTLIYDTGPAIGSMDSGENIVLPFLSNAQIKHVDSMIVSHGDNDHIGGAAKILSVLYIKNIFTSVPDEMADYHAQYCVAGQSWQWDGVQFTMLYPAESMLGLGNDSSCVLRIDAGMHSILLTGDIEKAAEKYLVQQAANQLKADILIAPHHGSKTSALKEFVSAVAPKYVVYATGYRNRYHFPHQIVIKTYSDNGVQQINSADTGAVEFTLSAKQALVQPKFYRQDHMRYWFAQAD